MSTESIEGGESNDTELTRREKFKKACDKVMENLPERFQKNSKPASGSNKFLLVPSYPREEDSMVLFGSDIEILKNEGFEFDFVSNSNKGMGINFWFKYNGQ